MDWANHSFGDSDDGRIFESKRLIDVQAEGSDGEHDAANFSFCESDKKSQPRVESQQREPQMTFGGENLFAAPVPEDVKAVERLLRRPTAVFVPCYADAGELSSDTQVRDRA